MTELFTNNGASFVLDTSYRSNVVSVSDGTTHADSTLIGVFDGSQTVAAQVMANNSDVIFTYPSPSVNYVQYDGVALSGLLSDSVSLFFWFRPSLVPSATVRCRLLTNTAAASAATGLSSNLAMTVNALTRTDMAGVSNQIASLTANQSSTFARPIELITLGIIGVSPAQLTISPVSDFVSSGPAAGPFSPHAQTYTLTNSGGATLNWAATKDRKSVV